MQPSQIRYYAPMLWSAWVHGMFSTRGHWLPGDPRGFRDHDHRVHSNGDYRHPPPPGEHEGLLKHALTLLQTNVRLPAPQRGTIALALAGKLLELDAPPRILCVDAVHGHVLFRAASRDAETLLGRAKQLASHRVREVLPGRIWGQHSHCVRIREESHYRSVVDYIARHPGAFIWIHPDVRPGTGSRQASNDVEVEHAPNMGTISP